MPRFYLPPDAWSDPLVLTGDEARHLTQVLRIQPGASITVFAGDGRQATAEVLSVARDSVALRLLGETVESPQTLPRITLAQAIPKGKNMDWIVQKSVELGVAKIQPLVTRYTVVQPGDGKSDKWRRNALEACKQCGQNRLPQIDEPAKFAAWLTAQAQAPGLKLIASLAAGAAPLREILRSQPQPEDVTLLIGPEGDFSGEETAAALAAGFLAISLGEIVLRVETASLFCISALRYEYAAAE